MIKLSGLIYCRERGNEMDIFGRYKVMEILNRADEEALKGGCICISAGSICTSVPVETDLKREKVAISKNIYGQVLVASSLEKSMYVFDSNNMYMLGEYLYTDDFIEELSEADEEGVINSMVSLLKHVYKLTSSDEGQCEMLQEYLEETLDDMLYVGAFTKAMYEFIDLVKKNFGEERKKFILNDLMLGRDGFFKIDVTMADGSEDYLLIVLYKDVLFNIVGDRVYFMNIIDCDIIEIDKEDIEITRDEYEEDKIYYKRLMIYLNRWYEEQIEANKYRLT